MNKRTKFMLFKVIIFPQLFTFQLFHLHSTSKSLVRISCEVLMARFSQVLLAIRARIAHHVLSKYGTYDNANIYSAQDTPHFVARGIHKHLQHTIQQTLYRFTQTSYNSLQSSFTKCNHFLRTLNPRMHLSFLGPMTDLAFLREFCTKTSSFRA